MKAKPARHAPPTLQRTERKEASRPYVLTLYVAGQSPKSGNAIANVKSFCESNLSGRYTLEVIDLYQQPRLALEAQIVAVPVLIRTRPAPVRRIIGDMSNTARVLEGLDLGKAA